MMIYRRISYNKAREIASSVHAMREDTSELIRIAIRRGIARSYGIYDDITVIPCQDNKFRVKVTPRFILPY